MISKLKIIIKHLNFKPNILKIFLVFLLILFNNSCSLPTNWIFVNQSNVDMLLQSPEFIDFEGGKYELACYWSQTQSRSLRGGGSTLISKAIIGFQLLEKYDNKNLSAKLKATEFWLINKKYKYYYQTSNLEHINNIYSLDPTPYYSPIFNSETGKNFDVAIVKFISLASNQTYFIKTFIY